MSHKDAVTKGDPVVRLNRECIFQILSYAASFTEEDNTMSGASIFYYRLALVSRSWKELLDDVMGALMEGVNVYFSQNRAEVEWLCRHKPKIRALRIAPDLDSPWQMSAYGNVLRECDTSELQFLGVILNVGRTENRRVHLLEELHEAAVRACPAVKNLRLCLSGDVEENPSYIDSPLLSLRAINSLQINVPRKSPIERIDEMLVSKIIKNFSHLEHLQLKNGMDNPRFAHPEGQVIHIQAPSVTSLDVSEYSTRVNFVLDCPKLELFCCSGKILGSDVGEGNMLLARLYVLQKVVRAESVPRSCLCLITDINRPEAVIVGAFKLHALLRIGNGMFHFLSEEILARLARGENISDEDVRALVA